MIRRFFSLCTCWVSKKRGGGGRQSPGRGGEGEGPWPPGFPPGVAMGHLIAGGYDFMEHIHE